MIAAQKSPVRTLPDCLLECGWSQADRLQSAFRLTTPQGDAGLERNPASSHSSWSEWILKSPHLPQPNPHEVFAANHHIDGPWKFVTMPAGEIHCRGDFPREANVTDDAFDLAAGRAWSPLQSWAEAATRIAQDGSTLSADYPKPEPETLVHWLKEQGYVASEDGEAVKVTVPLSGTFREIAVDWGDKGIAHLQAEIGRLSGWPDSSLAAAEDFLAEANRRLRLVRVTQPDEEKVFNLEACFRAPGPGVWLQSALDALCTGMAVLVQPLAALRDPGVADMLLAGRSAKRKGGVR